MVFWCTSQTHNTCSGGRFCPCLCVVVCHTAAHQPQNNKHKQAQQAAQHPHQQGLTPAKTKQCLVVQQQQKRVGVFCLCGVGMQHLPQPLFAVFTHCVACVVPRCWVCALCCGVCSLLAHHAGSALPVLCLCGVHCPVFQHLLPNPIVCHAHQWPSRLPCTLWHPCFHPSQCSHSSATVVFVLSAFARVCASSPPILCTQTVCHCSTSGQDCTTIVTTMLCVAADSSPCGVGCACLALLHSLKRGQGCRQ